MWCKIRGFGRFLKRDYSEKCEFGLCEEVKCALANKQPVVALESTIITHGMPYPDNLKCALELESTVRSKVRIHVKKKM